MTKVQVRYTLQNRLDEALMERIARARGMYGFFKIQVAPGLDQLLVEYDASRLSVDKVENSLHRAGIAVQRITQ